MIWVFFALFGKVSFHWGFRLWLMKNPLFVEKFSDAPDLPKQKKFWEIQKLGLSDFPNSYKHCAQNSFCQLSSNNSHHCLIIHARMSSPFSPGATSSLNIPVQLLAPPTLPSLGDCFPHGSVDSGEYFLYSSALSRRACWRT